MSKVLLKVKNSMDKSRWSHGCCKKVVLNMQKDSSQVFLGSLEIFFFMQPDFTKVEHFLNENMENIPIISKTFPE